MKKRKMGRPRVKIGWKAETFSIETETYEKWKDMCDSKDWGYGERITELMKEDLARLRPQRNYICPVCGFSCMSLDVLEEHGDRKHPELGGNKVVSMWHEKFLENTMSKKRKKSIET